MAVPGARSRTWQHAAGSLGLDAPLVMAVLNVTPDSFHDGGRLTVGARVDPGRVREAGVAAVEAGAHLLDLGGESTRPGADPVGPDEERERVVPALEVLRELGLPVSVDTRRASVARAAVQAGAAIINDVSGLADPQMAQVVAESGAGLVIGHMRGQPKTMQAHVAFGDLLREVAEELAASVREAEAAGIDRARLVVDPGVGFGKTPQQSAALVCSGATLQSQLGLPVMIGASRKSFIGAVSPSTTDERLPGSLAAAVVAAQRGAAILRVHDVAATVQALAVAAAIERAFGEAGEGA